MHNLYIYRVLQHLFCFQDSGFEIICTFDTIFGKEENEWHREDKKDKWVKERLKQGNEDVVHLFFPFADIKGQNSAFCGHNKPRQNFLLAWRY